ncbi:hypothetical protein HYS95_02940 [Candidatus Daviesbacteria bacterium]|nr:hypothetical protein [Candidatus Daviesbacteria bacterium]
MSKIIFKIVPVLILWGVFILVVLKIPYPDNITSANITQVSAFFIPLFLALTLTFNLFFKYIIFSTILSLGIIFLLALKALDSLNIVTIALTAVAIYLLLSYFKKVKRKNLTKLPKISKLTRLRKQ